MDARVVRVAALLGGSGMSALIYQMAWLRELRHVFGGSTAASAAVLAIFMGGLGLGGAILGRRADRHPSPLAFYGNLEVFIACSAALSPFLISIVGQVYIALGGSMALGMPLATVVRLGLSALVLGIPTFLMGGTLPAAGKSVETDEDLGRRHVALLYGTNTLGAVFGAAFATFYMLETFGTRNTLWLACLLNVLVALAARSLARSQGSVSAEEIPPRPVADHIPSSLREGTGTGAASAYVLIAAALVGFAFLLMELVWYRMLAPLLGGTTYTFGLILSIALLGIGLGSALYSALGKNYVATVRAFAMTVSLEAAALAIPFALGDRLAVFATVLRGMSSTGFSGYIAAWTLVTLVVVLPAAIVSGYQFPLLIALLGQGRKDVGKQTGYAYAANTTGAIVGSLAGGFGLLPFLTAPGAWQVVIYLLAGLGFVAVLISAVNETGRSALLIPTAIAALALALTILPLGPTAAWRHSGIGAGRSLLNTSSRIVLQDSIHEIRHSVSWEGEGIESSVAINASNGYAFVVNGKVDGNSISDAPTQVMLGMVSAILHPEPRRAMVIGLGTGSSAGWLGKIDTMERVDTVELEPAILEVARLCAPVNGDVLNNPKVNIIIGDGREILLTAPDQYDLIVSEPSNPYRAGIASLYTVEFYRGVAERLSEGGIFSQWVQAYEIDTNTIRTIYATLAYVFPIVETWQTKRDDLLLVCSMTPIDYTVPRLRRRVTQEPFRSALLHTWHTDDLEGFLSRYVADTPLAQGIAHQERGRLNTDDRTLVEFGFGRTLGRFQLLSIDEIRETARVRGVHRPGVQDGVVDWASVDEQRMYIVALTTDAPPLPSTATQELRERHQTLMNFQAGRLKSAANAWRRQPRSARHPLERIMVAEAFAEGGLDDARPIIDALRQDHPIEAAAIMARLVWRQEQSTAAAAHLARAFENCRNDPWGALPVVRRAIELAQEIANTNTDAAPILAEALKEPFSVHLLDTFRLHAGLDVASKIDYAHALPFIEAFEPHVPWRKEFLRYRFDCYHALGHPLLPRAEADLTRYLAMTGIGFNDALLIKEQAAPAAPN